MKYEPIANMNKWINKKPNNKFKHVFFYFGTCSIYGSVSLYEGST